MLLKGHIQEVIISQKEILANLDVGVTRKNNFSITDSFALIITGIRRSGKSTLLHQLMKNNKSYYLNLEDPRLEGFDLSDFMKIESIMKELYGDKGIYFFDEIQNIDKWEKFVRYLVDKKEKVVITGSNANLLNRELATKLTGRHLQIEVFPFSYAEYLSLINETSSIKNFEYYLNNGGFAEYLIKKNPLILQELLSDVVIKDISVRHSIKNVSILNKIAIYLISNVGKEFSYNSIKHMFEIKSVQSVIDYISFLEDTYLFFTISKFSYSYKKQQQNPKKVYSIDNGLSSANTVSFSKDKGKMLENLVFLALRRKYAHIFYYSENNECDFIIKEKESVTMAIQVCYDFNLHNKDREIKGLIEALNEFKLNKGIILTYNQEDEFIIDNKKIILMPVFKWLSTF